MSFSISDSLVWHLETINTVDASLKAAISEDPFFTRRPHKKCRSGCLGCKRRRQKCDETRPSCSTCSYRQEKCEYPQQALGLVPKILLPNAITADSISIYQPDSLSMTGSNLRHMLKIPTLNPCSLSAPHFEDQSLLDTLQHFHNIAHGSLGHPTMLITSAGQVSSQSSVPPYLLNAFLSFAGLHLNPLNLHSLKNKLSATCFGIRAIQLFSKEIRNGLNVRNKDAVVLCCIILSALAFHTENSRISSSTIIFSEPEEVNWLFVMASLGGISRQVTLQQKNAPNMTSHYTQVIALEENSFPSNSKPSELHLRLAELCGIDTESTAGNNPYLTAVQLILELEAVEPGVNHLTKFLSFPREMTPQYATLVTAKDPRALLLLSYWLAKMCKIDCWWCIRRARVEYQAIFQYLYEIADSRIRILLVDLKESCWYEMTV